MAERRSLIEGLNALEDVDPDMAADFIQSGKPRKNSRLPARTTERKPAHEESSPSQPAPPPQVAPQATPSPLTGVGRVPVGARVRTELAAALKRASLERQLQGIQPNSVQDILEESLELWLHKHGLLK